MRQTRLLTLLALLMTAATGAWAQSATTHVVTNDNVNSIFSGDGTDVLERLDKGLVDFGIVFQHADPTKYESVEIPLHDTWGVLMRKDSPLAGKKGITIKDLKGCPLIIPRQPNHNTMISDLLEKKRPMQISSPR
jgi:DNA-binding transcriptional LysR family regulator